MSVNTKKANEIKESKCLQMENDKKRFIIGIISVGAICLVIIAFVAMFLGGNNKGAINNPSNTTTKSTVGEKNDTTENSSIETRETASNIGENNTMQTISEIQAKQKVFDELKISEKDVSNVTIRKDTDNGVSVYEVGFDYNGTEYDYEVSAQTGEIIEKDKELID